jgi:predicted nucleotidyltransferase
MNSRVLSEHPVSDDMRAAIMRCLDDIEAQHQVKVLFACESGSRGWGFASPDSDYDVRFVYVNRIDWYLSIEQRRDVIEQPISGDLDVNGWDVRKALKLLHSSNPVLLEWLRSPIVYAQDEELAPRLRRLAEEHLSLGRAYHHYVSMAKKNLREHLFGETVRYKKYLYVLRPLLAARWIRSGRGAPPMRFADLAEATLDDPALIAEINRLLAVKMRAGEAATSARWDSIHAFILAELDEAIAHAPAAGERGSTEELDAFLQTCVSRYGQRRVKRPLQG